jgi:putative transcriptional regulator
MSKQTMREFDELCLTPVPPLTPEEIRELREREGAGQTVFTHT